MCFTKKVKRTKGEYNTNITTENTWHKLKNILKRDKTSAESGNALAPNLRFLVFQSKTKL